MEYDRLFNAVRRLWYVVLACSVAGVAISWAYVRFMPEEYTATADILVVVSGDSATDLSSGSTFALQQARNLSVIANSSRVVEPVVRRLNLPYSAAKLSESISATVPSNTSIVTLEVRYTSADQAAAIVNALADSLVQNATDLFPPGKKNGAAVSLRPIYEASVPQTKSSLHVATGVAIGLAGGLIAGLALVLLLESALQRRTTESGAQQPVVIQNWDF